MGAELFTICTWNVADWPFLRLIVDGVTVTL